MTAPAAHRDSHRSSRFAVRAQRAWRDVRRVLTWGRLYHATSYIESALWAVPLIAIVLVLMMVPALRWVDDNLNWQFTAISPAGAQALYQTVITLTLSFLVFTFGSLLVAIQVAGGQLTPRIIATILLSDNVVRYSVGLFTFTLLFAVMSLNRQGSSVNQLLALIIALLGIACIADFLFLIDYAARLLRPVSVVASVGDDGVRVINAVYPASGTEHPVSADALRATLGAPVRTTVHQGHAGVVMAMDIDAVVALARRSGGVVEFVPQVGDFVAADDPLFTLYGGAVAISDPELRATVAFGAERTLEQDPLFAFRILVDIALKALSPAINDPTTAVLAIDQVHRLLRLLGKRHLHDDVSHDETGAPRLILRTPNWEDFVHIACNEIRACGGGSMQIVRRMRAMLENLARSLPEHRKPSLMNELRLLDLTIDASFALPEDRALARIADTQGLGGGSTPAPTTTPPA